MHPKLGLGMRVGAVLLCGSLTACGPSFTSVKAGYAIPTDPHWSWVHEGETFEEQRIYEMKINRNYPGEAPRSGAVQLIFWPGGQVFRTTTVDEPFSESELPMGMVGYYRVRGGMVEIEFFRYDPGSLEHTYDRSVWMLYGDVLSSLRPGLKTDRPIESFRRVRREVEVEPTW